jgi:hypothetical protein
VAAIEVRLWQFIGDPLLPGIDHLGLRTNGLNLGDVLGFHRITENDAHPQFSQSGEFLTLGIE